MPSQHKRAPLSFRPAADLRARLEAYTAQTGRPAGAVISEALSAFLNGPTAAADLLPRPAAAPAPAALPQDWSTAERDQWLEAYRAGEPSEPECEIYGDLTAEASASVAEARQLAAEPVVVLAGTGHGKRSAIAELAERAGAGPAIAERDGLAAAVAAVSICICGDGKELHRNSRGHCEASPCACNRYRRRRP